MERQIEFLAAIQFLLIGLSHLFRPLAWIQFIERLRELQQVGAFIYGLLYLWTGTLIVAFHWQWTGIPGALTLTGCLLILKAAHCLLFPERQVRALARVSADHEIQFKLMGGLSVGFGCLLCYSLWQV